jgi:hypothetical protein
VADSTRPSAGREAQGGAAGSKNCEESEMIKRSKWVALSALACCGAMLFSGCLGAFWQGLVTTGWPESRWMNVALDVLKEVTINKP